eukprot:15154283-Alexandrium_andersonii.AAC.1
MAVKSAGAPPAWRPEPRQITRALSDPGKRRLIQAKLPSAILGSVKSYLANATEADLLFVPTGRRAMTPKERAAVAGRPAELAPI